MARLSIPPDGAGLVVGVSGGPDSLCLLHVLRTLSHERGWHLHVAHLHHGLRGGEADGDAEFVARVAAEWGLPCTVERAEVQTIARRRHLTIEETARQVRYAFLGRVARERGVGFVIAGHTADDQAETVLMHILRGAGLAGLRGMLMTSPLGELRLAQHDEGTEVPSPLPQIFLLRPLLEVPRAAVEAYCAQNGLMPRFDRSNLDQTFFRNRLRLELLPLLATYNPGIKRVLCHTAAVLADDYDFLHHEAQRAWLRVVQRDTATAVRFDLKEWRGLPSSLGHALLREAVSRLRCGLRNINWEHIERAFHIASDPSRGAGARATLPQGLMLTVGYDNLVVADANTPIPTELPQISTASIPLQVPGATLLPAGKWQIIASVLTPADLPSGWEDNADDWQTVVDHDAAGSRLWLRGRQPGDRFRPLGLSGHSIKLNEFFINVKVDRALRDGWPLIVGDAGIVWVPGLRLSEDARVRQGTQRLLLLELRRLTET